MRTAANDNAPLGGAIRFVVEPRLVPAAKAARRLHLTASQFHFKLGALRGEGFPSACGVTGHYDLKAIDRWIDSRSGFELSSDQTTADVTDLVKARIEALG